MRVAFLTTDFTLDPATRQPIPNGSAYYRCVLPMYSIRPIPAKMGYPAWLPERGFGVLQGDGTADFGFPVVMLKLLMESHIPHQIKGAQAIGQKVIVDVDDLYEGLDEKNIAYSETSPDKSRVRNRDHYLKSILLADAITVTTPYLKTHYSRLHPNVHLIRNGVNYQMFPVKQHTARKPVIGWVGGVHWRSGDVETLKPWLPDFLENHDLTFHHSGTVPFGETFADKAGIPPERFTSSMMVPLHRYPELFPPIDIGIVPLNDLPFNQAKSTAKGFEYAAAGVPFIAQALPEYARLASMGVGKVAETPDQWIDAMTLMLDHRYRITESTRNRALIETDHSIQARSSEWYDLIQSMFTK
jgi:hypothetical protein